MGDLRHPEVTTNNSDENSTGVERASNLLFDQFLQGDFNVRRNARPLLSEACQLNTLTLTGEKSATDLAVRANLCTLDTNLELKNNDFSAILNFTPDHGWNNPFRRPTYNLEAETKDRNTMLSINSKDGAAADVLFKHIGDRLSLNYTRNAETNQLTMCAEGGPRLPIKMNFSHGFRDKATKFELRSEQTDRTTFLNVSAKEGVTPTFQFSHLSDGLSVNYLRNADSNKISVTAEGGLRTPVNFNFGHDFRKNETTLGLNGNLSSSTEFGIGASVGPRNYYDASIYLQIGGKPRTIARAR
jgi:hypothetical protein